MAQYRKKPVIVEAFRYGIESLMAVERNENEWKSDMT